ncbi:MAG: TorF family putative porin [Mangrovibacterium sp.]
MKRTCNLLVFVLAAVFALNVQAQESSWSIGTDLVSNYIWRGLKFGTGPALQPTLEYSTGGFAIGAWGSYGLTDDEAPETDLYASYNFELSETSSFSVSLTDYYFPGSKYFEASSHYFEPAIALGLGNFSLSAAYMMSNQSGDEDVEDFYLQAGYTIGKVDLFIGGGDGQYSSSGNFNISNIGISTSKEIKISDSFSLPVFGSAILNPNAEQFYLVVGISL